MHHLTLNINDKLLNKVDNMTYCALRHYTFMYLATQLNYVRKAANKLHYLHTKLQQLLTCTKQCNTSGILLNKIILKAALKLHTNAQILYVLKIQLYDLYFY